MLFVFGAGPQGRLVVESAMSDPKLAVAYLDGDRDKRGMRVGRANVFGAPEDVADPQEHDVVVALGHPGKRREIMLMLKRLGFRRGRVIDPTANVSKDAIIHSGAMVCAGATVESGAIIGTGALVNTRAFVGHDATVGEYASVSPEAFLSGRTVVGDDAFIGVRATVLPRLTVGAGAIVGAAALVTKDVRARVIVVGLPAAECGEVHDEFDWGRVL